MQSARNLLEPGGHEASSGDRVAGVKCGGSTPPVAQKMRWLTLAEWPPRSSSGLTTVVRSVQIYTELLTMGDVV
jgi:hypothetical protein